MSSTPPLAPHASRPVITPAAACDLLSVRKTKLYELLAAGELASVKRGSRRYVFTDSVLALVATWRGQNVEAGNDNWLSCSGPSGRYPVIECRALAQREHWACDIWVVASCPFCGHRHTHGDGEGLRSAHCAHPLSGGTYYLLGSRRSW